MASTKVVRLDNFVGKYPQSVSLFLERRDNVVCRNRTTEKTKKVQFRALYENNRQFWNVRGTWDYFLEAEAANEVLETLRDLLSREGLPSTGSNGDTAEVPEKPRPDNRSPREEKAVESNFAGTYHKYQGLETPQRAGLLARSAIRLTELAKDPDVMPETVAEALIETTEEATMINRATLLEALKMGDAEAQIYSQEMVKATQRMVQSTIQLVDSEVYNDDLVSRLVEKSNGTVVQHMTRVFLRGLRFLLFYNRAVIRNGIAAKVRIRFPQRYRSYYAALVPHIHPDNVTLERVFYGGMKALSAEEIHTFATGFLVHDVGKADDIEYHEGDAGYDRSIVERHVKIGYRAVIDKTNYPAAAALITGYHHEYYGDPTGYGYFREFLQSYKNARPSATQDYIMSYTMEPVIDYEVLAFFPAKALEIVDVFDSLTDPNRLYRDPMEDGEALAMMQDEFIAKRAKLDPILYDLFVEFHREEAEARRGAGAR